MFDNMERFSRRTISISSNQEVMNEVAEVLHEAADEGDEDGITSDTTASGSRRQGCSCAYSVILNQLLGYLNQLFGYTEPDI